MPGESQIACNSVQIPLGTPLGPCNVQSFQGLSPLGTTQWLLRRYPAANAARSPARGRLRVGVAGVRPALRCCPLVACVYAALSCARYLSPAASTSACNASRTNCASECPRTRAQRVARSVLTDLRPVSTACRCCRLTLSFAAKSASDSRRPHRRPFSIEPNVSGSVLSSSSAGAWGILSSRGKELVQVTQPLRNVAAADSAGRMSALVPAGSFVRVRVCVIHLARAGISGAARFQATVTGVV